MGLRAPLDDVHTYTAALDEARVPRNVAVDDKGTLCTSPEDASGQEQTHTRRDTQTAENTRKNPSSSATATTSLSSLSSLGDLGVFEGDVTGRP